jgi:L-seryl-tRNA(Ser) seleniumtransferase
VTDVLNRWQLPPVINAAGTMTSLGSSRVLPAIASDVAAILGHFVQMDDLQARACAEIVRATGAEAGYVTASSAAAIMLAAAAAITGDDLALIEALPDTRGRQRRVALQMGHMVNYGAPVPQAIAVAGAEVVPLGTAALCETYHLEAALHDGLAAAVYVVSHHTVREGELPLGLFIDICRGHGVPVIVDMASEHDLRGPVAMGADAVIYSGHKFLSGTTSGIVAGRRGMIRSMYLQNRGIGRLSKVGKEGVLGAAAALAAWQRRDHQGEQAREAAIVDMWMERLSGQPGIEAGRCADWTGNPITRVELKIAPDQAGLFAWELAARLITASPAIAVRDDHAEHQRLYLDPCNLTMDEAITVTRAIQSTCVAARRDGDGRARRWAEEKQARGRATISWLAES